MRRTHGRKRMEKARNVSHDTPLIGTGRVTQVFDFEQLLVVGRVKRYTLQRRGTHGYVEVICSNLKC